MSDRRGADRIYAVTDAVSQRQLYFWAAAGPTVALSSMPELILDHYGETPSVGDPVKELWNSPSYRAKGLPWYGDSWYDPRIRQVLPNHVLEVQTNTVRRVPLVLPTGEPDETIRQAANMLTGSIEAVHHRYEVHQPVTAGFDSRVVLSASRERQASTRYFVFDRDRSTTTDVKIAKRLSDRLGLDLIVVSARPRASERFQRVHQAAFVVSSRGPLLANIEYHYDRNRDRDVVIVLGNGGEVARNRFIDPASECSLADYLIEAVGKHRLLRGGIVGWCNELADASDVIHTRLQPLDLFYWEQYLPYNKSRISLEYDLAVETFLPFNNRRLLLSLLSTPADWRFGPRYPLFRVLCERLWPETLSEAFNPIAGINVKERLAKLVFKHGQLSRYLIRPYNRLRNAARGTAGGI